MSVGAVNKNTGDRIPTAGNPLDKVGNLAYLHTTAKDDAVSAINEVKDEVSAIKDGTAIDSFSDVENALDDKTDDDAVAPEFDNNMAYSAGSLVYHDGTLYKFDSDHAAGAWDPTEVTQTSVAAEFNSLKNTLIAFPDYANATLIVNALTTYPHTYNVVDDGFIIFTRVCADATSGTRLEINNKSIIVSSNDVEFFGGVIPVHKNDVVVFSGLNNTSRASFAKFV